MDTNPTPSHQGANNYPMKFYITGTSTGLGKYLSEHLPTVDSLEKCDVFINNKFWTDGRIGAPTLQYNLLRKASQLKNVQTTVTIGSQAIDWCVTRKDDYSIMKLALTELNKQLYYAGNDCTIINFGALDTEYNHGKDIPKIPLDECLELIMWILDTPARIMEISVGPNGHS